MPELPPSQGRPQTDLATLSSAVNDSAGSDAPSSVRRFSPHQYLVALLSAPRALPGLSPAAVRLLGHALWRLGRQGEGEGCKSGEGMFAQRIESVHADRHEKTIACELGVAGVTVNRARKELEGAGLLRSSTVRALQRLPRLPGGVGGVRIREAVTLFFVDLDALRSRLGMQPARNQQNVGFETNMNELSTPQKPREKRGPCVKIATDLSVDDAVVNRTINHQEPQRERARTAAAEVLAGDGGGDGLDLESEIDALAAQWWQTIGRKHSALEAPTARQMHDLTTAIRGRLRERHPGGRTVTLEDCRAVLEARSDRRIGGAAWDYCEHPPRHPDTPIWGPGIFGGPFDHLLAAARRHETAQRSAHEARQRAAADRMAQGGQGAADVTAALVAAGLTAAPADADRARLESAGILPKRTALISVAATPGLRRSPP